MELLLAIEEYSGTHEAFWVESVTSLRAALGMSEKDAQRTLADLTQRKAIKAALTPRAENPHGRWKWVTK